MNRHMFSTVDIQKSDATMNVVVVRAGRPAVTPIFISGDLPLDSTSRIC